MAGSGNTEMPNLFVIGAEKCGTTSLHHYLDLHPEISMARGKEPGYFARPSAGYRMIRVRDRNSYLELFDAGTPVRGEANPSYSAFPEVRGTPALIAAELEDPKFVYLVRDPIERIESALRHWAAHGRFGATKGAIEVGQIPESHMVSKSRYMTQIEQYLEHFPPESLLIIDSDRLRHERRAVLTETFVFLRVDPDFDHPGFLEVRNAAESNRMPPVAWRRLRATHAAGYLTEVLPGRARLAIRRLRFRLSHATGDPIPEIALGEDLTRMLREELAPEVEAFRQFTGQDFPGWSF